MADSDLNPPDPNRLASASASTDTKENEQVELAVADKADTNGITTSTGEDKEDKENKEKAKDETHGLGIVDNIGVQLHAVHENVDKLRDGKYSRTECCCFFSFLLVFTIMAVLGRGISDISFTQTITLRQSLIERDEFIPWNDNGEKQFAHASTIEDIYRYLEDVAIPFLLKPDHDYYVQSQQRLLGGIRLKQLRMTPSKCRRDEFSGCYDSEYFKKTVFYSNSDGDILANFSYIDSSDILDQSWRGKYGTYPGGGFIVTLSLDKVDALNKIAFLRNISWMDAGTRFLAMDFNTFNPSTSLHTVARLAWEMPTGGVFPNDEIKTWKFERYVNADGKALAAFHVLFLIWVIGMSLMEFTSCFRMGCLRCGKNKDGKPSYWNSKWKGLDAVNLFFFYMSIILYIVNQTSRSINMYSSDSFISFRQLQYGFTYEAYFTALNGALLWIKLFKYLAVNKRLRFLFTMLGRSSTDILMFAIVLGVFVVAFGTAGFLTFNSDVDDFRSYVFSMSNMVRFTLVDMNYSALSLSSRLWGSFFYFLWSLLMLLILANVFIAILTEAYSQVQMELTDDDKIDLNFLGMGGAFNKIKEAVTNRISIAVQHEEFDDDGDGKVSAKELADQCNITVERAQDIIAEYDDDGDGQLDKDEFEKLKQQIINEQVEAEKLEIMALQQARSEVDVVDMLHVPNITTKEFEDLKGEVQQIMELLTAVLDQTPAGKRALKQRDIEKQKEDKHKRRRSSIKASLNK